MEKLTPRQPIPKSLEPPSETVAMHEEIIESLDSES
jgi:hypothetical protein